MNTKSIMSRKRQRMGSHPANNTQRRIAFFQQCMELACQSQLIQLFYSNNRRPSSLDGIKNTYLIGYPDPNQKSWCHAISSKKSVFATIFAKYWHCLCIQNLQQNRDPDLQKFKLLYFRFRSSNSNTIKFNHRFTRTDRLVQIGPTVESLDRPR